MSVKKDCQALACQRAVLTLLEAYQASGNSNVTTAALNN